MKSDIVFAGNLSVDIMKRINAYPASGMLCDILEITQSVGGCACNNAISYKKLFPHRRVQSAGLIGTDAYGEYALSVLQAQGVDTSLVRRTREASTSFTDVITDDGTRQRTFFQMRGTSSLYLPGEEDWAALDTSVYFLGYILLLEALDAPDAQYGTRMARMLHRAQQKGCKTATDIVSLPADHSQTAKYALKYCDYFFCNELDAQMITHIPLKNGQGQIDTAAVYASGEAMLACGVREAVIIHAPEGAWAVTPAGIRAYAPAARLPAGYIQGTVGAGDTFCAGVLGALAEGMPFTRALQAGNAAAAMALSRVNSFDGILTMEEGLRIYDEDRWAELMQ